jgi:hypothetical protein
VIERLTHGQRATFPELLGFSLRNFKYMCAFAKAWTNRKIAQAALVQLPWYQQLALPTELQTSLPIIKQIECELGNLAVKGESA